MQPAVRCRVDEGIAWITLNRPETRNSLTVSEMVDMGIAFQRAAHAGVRCILVSGEGGAFCAGRDLKRADPAYDDTYDILARHINPALTAVRRCEVPTIAAVAGPALGFGLGLALACDITLVADNALLGSPFRKIGLLPDSGAHYYLRERLGRHRAAELILTGRLVSGREAAAMGLVNRSVGASSLEALAREMALDIASGPTRAFRSSKKILDCPDAYEQMAELEAQLQSEAIKGHDGMEGIQAFQEKRAPQFIGS
ncbi:enoyl-CoA hydratase/isomerase family protein [Burkholderia pseudomallei]|uniref:Enoyl-CoA hydratase/isomerase family protein n=1 Tax=Burkholderia pseudomallei TaxID=28450 RepID=A0A8A4EG72_BURPE|nr:enoyl-CoA hydratase-related protein [Burkholderia pseudomallei]ARK94650.1 enoyl-CoA hydratase [Burkholderia pseudomallei]KKI72744.1 enoyl-CoA hydratase [Burkholderia pseudomallei]MBF3899966.1 enoyl-CoA hydratase/isomerase family protein [Burkholderia pseudomallei]MBO2952037.1 enoyl-CoA hydratase/isomerase family protein [Burkholderia pseudomallei]MBO2964140.1 enoyl-CoA hydratase/isomerase family protein [Burkholderia pseudomallei]